MRETTPSLPEELEKHRRGAPVSKAPAYEVASFRALVEQIARVAYSNPDELLFFRGQDKDFQSKAGGTTLYPAIYRGDSLPARELRHRFEILELAARILVERFKSAQIEGHRELRQKRYIQWSILQHYEVVSTPLLDLTQSLRVACSFAQLRSTGDICYVYVLGLPYLSNRISINSEHDIVNVRLLSICPPSALRPYFQEGYLAGTADVTTEFDSKTELDFKNRLIAKFAIPKGKHFWGIGFDQIPESALYPQGDRILELCSRLKDEISPEFQPGQAGEFVKEWSELEDDLLESARRLTERNVSVREAITELAKRGRLQTDSAIQLEFLRSLRNSVVHHTRAVDLKEIEDSLDTVLKFRKQFERKHNS